MADYPDHLSEGIAELSRLLVNEEALEDTLHRVAELACRNIGGADLAGVTLLRDDRATTAVFTDPTSPEIDAEQYRTGTGPCLDAFRHEQVNRIDSTADDERWPAFSKAAAEHGIQSTISLPLVVMGRSARGAPLGEVHLEDLHPTEVEPRPVRCPHQPDLHGTARRAPQDGARRPDVGPQLGHRAGVGARGARRAGHGHVDDEDLGERPCDGVAVDRSIHVSQPPVGPKRSVRTSSPSCPSSMSTVATASTNGVGPHT
jgi:hypothetical protein